MDDRYLSKKETRQRLYDEWKKYGKGFIIAYDFDNTVYDYHNRGDLFPQVVQLLRRAEKFGAFFIVFTGCDDESVEFKVQPYLNAAGIPYDNINRDKPGITNTSRKIYYNILLDDRAGLHSAFNDLRHVLDRLEAEAHCLH